MATWRGSANLSDSSGDEARDWDFRSRHQYIQRSGFSVEDSPGPVVSGPLVLTNHVERRVQALKNLLVEAISVERKFHEEYFTLQCKYQPRLKPLYLKRAQIVAGWYEPSQEETQCSSSDEEKESEIQPLNKLLLTAESSLESTEWGIPNFWLIAIKNASFLADLVEPHDERVLTHLIDIRVLYSTAPMGFTLEFHWEPNNYLKNSKLTKEYYTSVNPDPSDLLRYSGPRILHSKGCTIDWYPHMNVTVKTITKRAVPKIKGSSKYTTTVTPTSSFFNMFKSQQVAEDGSLDDNVKQLLESDFQIATFIKDQLIPRAVLYYTREALVEDELTVEEQGGAAEPEREEDSAKGPCSPSAPDNSQQEKCNQQ